MRDLHAINMLWIWYDNFQETISLILLPLFMPIVAWIFIKFYDKIFDQISKQAMLPKMLHMLFFFDKWLQNNDIKANILSGRVIKFNILWHSNLSLIKRIPTLGFTRFYRDSTCYALENKNNILPFTSSKMREELFKLGSRIMQIVWIGPTDFEDCSLGQRFS